MVSLQTSLYILLGSVAFIVPMFSMSPGSITKAVTALVFIVGACSGLVQSIPIIAAAGLGSGENDSRGWYTTDDVQKRSIAALDALLKGGANIEAKGGQRMQPALHGAATWGWSEVVQFLVDRGANINSKDARGLTALDAAMGRTGGNGRGGQLIEPHTETAKLIEKLGGVAGTPLPATPARGGRGAR